MNPITGQPIRGGLVYAGVNGANEYQGDPPGMKFSPRLGFVHSFNPKTVLRAGYGIYWAPWNYQAVGTANYGNIGFSQQTFISQNQFRPSQLLGNPFPNGVLSPVGNQLGALAGVNSQMEFIDQDKRAPWVQQYSVDINRELPGNMAVGFEYSGSTGRDLGLGGSNDGVININQVPSQYLALGPALLEQVPNPFFGLPNVVINGASFPQGKSVTSPTIQRRELLRPYPQFNDILMRQSTYGESQYHAAIFKFEKRMSNGWGGRINYTYSRLEDNQFGEDNFFAGSPGFVGAVPSEMANVDITQDDYGVDAEYGIGLLDVPHKLVFSPIAELPFGEGKKWLNERDWQHPAGRLDGLVDHLDRERLPADLQHQHQHVEHLHPRAAAERDARRRPMAAAMSASLLLRGRLAPATAAPASGSPRRGSPLRRTSPWARCHAPTTRCARRTATTGTSWRARASASATAACAPSSASRC